MDPATPPKRSAGIHAPVGQGFEKAPVAFQRGLDDHSIAIFDPDRPSMGPNELLAELGDKPDPYSMLHGCPLCNREPMHYMVFSAHKWDCFLEYQQLHPRNFAGATRKDAV